MHHRFPICLLLALCLPSASGALRGPYHPDAHTPHLYHFDEPAGATVLVNSGTAGGVAIVLNGNPIQALPPTVDSATGATGLPGFGNAVDFTGQTGHFIGYDGNGDGVYQADVNGATPSPDRIALSTLGISGGSPFTLEAMVFPGGTTGARQILSTDSSAASRGFQFRLVTGGATGQRLEFHLIGTGNQLFAELPAGGEHAFTAGAWFHAAFSYDGTTARFYWTRVAQHVTAANLVASHSLGISGGGGIQGPLVIGNENRAVAGEGLNGRIDEVRISSVARGPHDFIFALDDEDSDGDGMADAWEMLHFGTLDRDGTGDFDGDGFTDLEEYLANSHPGNSLWTPETAALARRWSFDGTLHDAIHGTPAWIVDTDDDPATGGGAGMADGTITLGGGPRASSSYLQLGTGGLFRGRTTPAAIELWATPHSPQNWARIFDFGSGTSSNLFMSWTRGSNPLTDRVEWRGAGTTAANDTCAPYLSGTMYHILMTIEPGRGAGGSTRVTWYAAPAGDLLLGPPMGAFDTTETLAGLNDIHHWLGRSMYAADSTANASYHEFRIWDGVPGGAQREALHAAGPDADLIHDVDGDGLPDEWEYHHFGHLDFGPDDDPDMDGFTNAQEQSAGSLPNVAASTPHDTDGDGLPDAWELHWFGHLRYGAEDDPDGDGENNATEFANGSVPTNRASTSVDIDADGLPDAWEIEHFGHLDHNGGSDPDGDGFSNLQEFLAGTNPADPASRPPGTAVRLIPIDDGDPATSEFGFAGDSAINTVSFVRSSLKSVGNQQFVTWYGRHQYDPNARHNNTLWIGRRTLADSEWQVFRHPTFTANDINDGHDVISFGIDGDGYMHLSWGMHGDDFHYSRSVNPVTGDGPIQLGPDTSMTGNETIVTYPQFLTLPDGDLLYLFRRFYSGNGAQFLNRYSLAEQRWRPVHVNGSGQPVPFMSGMWAPLHDYNPYVNMPQLGGADGNELTLVFNWRYLPVNGPGAPGSPGGFVGYQTNNRLNFAVSPDAGLSWQRSDGSPYALPIIRNGENGQPAGVAEVIVDIPEGHSLINQAGMCLDRAGNPVAATWWAPEAATGDHRRQYMVVFRHQDGTWQYRPVSNRISDPPGTRFSEAFVRNLGRPVVVTDDDDRIIIAYRDNQGDNRTGITNGLTIVHSLPHDEDPDRLLWIELDLTDENLGNYEPIIDNELWDRERQLHFLYQPSAGQGYAPPANNAARISVLEWNAEAYFNQRPVAELSITPDGTHHVISCHTEPSWSYRLWTSGSLDDWQLVETRAGTGGRVDFTQPVNPQETRRFWRIQMREGGF